MRDHTRVGGVLVVLLAIPVSIYGSISGPWSQAVAISCAAGIVLTIVVGLYRMFNAWQDAVPLEDSTDE